MKAIRNYPDSYRPQPCCLTCENSRDGDGRSRAIKCKPADVVVGVWCICDEYVGDTAPHASEKWSW